MPKFATYLKVCSASIYISMVATAQPNNNTPKLTTPLHGII